MLKIIVVDDHSYFRQSLVAFLKETSLLEVVAEARNGKEAVELAERLRPQMVIMDIRMPDMDGIEACRAIKKIHPQISVLLYTMYDIDICSNYGGTLADYCLHKDKVYEELPGIIREFVQKMLSDLP